ncbi:MAG: hypothetical protein AB1349_13815 [Elusimicrobiota bacterium]
MSRYKKVYLILLIFIFVLCFLKLSTIEKTTFSSKRIYDRNGILLREIYSSEYGTAYPIKLGNLPEHFIDTVIITEDNNFSYNSFTCFLPIPSLKTKIFLTKPFNRFSKYSSCSVRSVSNNGEFPCCLA